MSLAFMYLMAAFSATILLYLIVVAIFDGIYLVAGFFGLLLLILMGGVAGKTLAVTNSKLINGVYSIVNNPLVTFVFMLLSLVGIMFLFGGDIEKRAVIIFLIVFAIMLVSLPQFVKHRLLTMLMDWFITNKIFSSSDIAVPDLAFIAMGFSLYVVAIILSAYKIDHK
jgi:hypothetical protein